MHTKLCSGGTQFFFYGDFSGELYIAKLNGEEIKIPARDVLELVAREYVLPKLVSNLEDLSDSKLLEHLFETLG